MALFHGYLGLGSNLGDRAGHLRRAARLLTADPRLRLLAASRVHASAPVGFASANEFLNQVLEVEWSGPLEALLALALAIQQRPDSPKSTAAGEASYADRELDIDLLHFDGAALEGPALTLPHPRLCERAFVLLPLTELAPGLMVQGRTVHDWIARLAEEERAGVKPLTA